MDAPNKIKYMADNATQTVLIAVALLAHGKNISLVFRVPVILVFAEWTTLFSVG